MRLATALLLCLAAEPLAASSVHKWRDASGQMHYSQIPPPAGAVVQPRLQRLQPDVLIETGAPRAAPAAAEIKPAEAKPVVLAETKQARTERCTAARERVAFLEESTARRLVTTLPDGSEERMSEEEFEKTLAKARDAGKGC